ncbi:MAG: peptidoglycan-binding domain-containing protein [Verrucomicrobiota bacterium]
MDRGRGIIRGLVVVAALAAAACGVRGPGKEAAANEENDEAPLAAVQALLRRERLYTGPVDGAPGAATAAAIRRYQILHGMRATGRLDPGTLHAMLAPAPPPSGALTAADREILRELAETPRPEPVAERRLPIPASPPPAIAAPSATPQSKAVRSRSAKHRRAGSTWAPSD